jgi:hypothetical protein
VRPSRPPLGNRDLSHFIATYCPPGDDGKVAPAFSEDDVLVKAAAIRAGW